MTEGTNDTPIDVQVEFTLTARGVNNLGEALDTAALSLIREGLDSFFVLANNLTTGESWVVHNGDIFPASEAEERIKQEQGAALTAVEGALDDQDPPSDGEE